MARATRKTWAERVRQWRRSGLPAREFAERRGLNTKTLWWWAWRLAREQKAKQPSPAFVEVVAHAEPVAPAASSVARALEVVVAGARVVVPVGFDEETLRRLVRVLEGR